MATKVTQSWDGEIYRDGSPSSRGKKFMVTFDRNANPEAACWARGIPRRGDAMPGDDSLVVTDSDARPLGPLCYEVTVNYGSPTAEEEKERQENPRLIAPWNRPWTIAVGTQSESLAFDQAIDGKKIANSAGVRFDPPPQREETDLTIQVVRNHQQFDLAKARKYNNSTNADTFCAYAPASVRINIVGEYQQEAKWIFWRVTYTLRFRDGTMFEVPNPWDVRLADRGFQQSIGLDAQMRPVLRPIKNDDGGPVTEPVLLDGSGKPATKNAGTFWLQFQTYKRLSYAALGLEANIKRALAGKLLVL